MRRRLSVLCAAVVSGLFWLAPANNVLAQGTTPDWKDDWSLASGFTIDADTEGFNFPSDIEFIPNPGSRPEDPLYFVLELKGTLKVVTNDRTTHIFAKDFIPIPLKESFQEIGSAGMCLDPVRGYVYVTFGYLDKTQVFRNGMVRFTATPETFGLAAGERLFLLDIFANERSDTSHQIGPCAISDDQLYVPVGYGKERSQSQNLQTTLGSILRMDLDLQPAPDNPFATDDGETTAVDYIWTYGHRNVFGLDFVGDRLFITENGGSIDRVLEVEGGENYLWRGDDWSIAARAAFIFGPSVGLVQLDYLSAARDIFPEEFRDQFFIALAGGPGATGPGRKGERSVTMLRYDFDNNRAAEPPNMLLAYRGKGQQLPVSVAFGPDGLYFVALLPQRDGSTPVMKITYDPARGHPHVLGQDAQPEVLINNYGCRQCHRIGPSGGNFGPRLAADRIDGIRQRINGPDYPAHVATIDALNDSPFTEYRDERGQILEASGEDRLKLWLSTYLREPAFDNPESKMPNAGVTPAHAKIIADYLINITSPEQTVAIEHGPLDRLRFAIARFVPELRYRHVIGSFAVGGAIGLILMAGLFLLIRRKRPL
ncbi:MAG: hypothetical protein HOK11_12665 [Rhodospirillaceae bacterium]|jgi:hypothetical protein|nr:hypothetical protein [Rhodospirillaceae bacterium]